MNNLMEAFLSGGSSLQTALACVRAQMRPRAPRQKVALVTAPRKTNRKILHIQAALAPLRNALPGV